MCTHSTYVSNKWIYIILRWHPHTILHLAGVFKDISLSKEELLYIIEKIIATFEEISADELPPLIYQLLVLSSKVRYIAFIGYTI